MILAHEWCTFWHSTRTMNKKFLLFYMLLAFSGSAVHAQKSWTLDACVAYALEHNLQLNNLNYATESNRESYRQSYRNLLPSVSAGSNYSILYGRSIDPNTNAVVNSDFFSNNYNLGANLDIFNGFQKLNSITASKLLYHAAKEDAENEKYLLAFRVMTGFYNVMYYQEQIKIAKGQFEISSGNIKLVKREIDLGVKAGADLYEAQSVLEGDKLALIQAENNYKTARLSLMQEMNLESAEDFSIDTSANELMTGRSEKSDLITDSIYREALDFIPTIKSGEYRLGAAKSEVAKSRGKLFPSLTFFTGYSTGYYETNVNDIGNIIPFRNQIRDNASKYVGLSLSVPVFEAWSRRSAVKQQKIALLEAKNNLDIRKQELNKLIRQLVQDYTAGMAEYEQTQQNVLAQSMAFEIAQKKYSKGMISILELNQVKNAFAKAQNENLQVMSKLKVQEKTIDFYRGLPVFNINTNN